MTGDANVILVAGPDPDELARFQSWLDDEYRVETVTNGDDALALLETVDVAVIDRELQTASGSAVVAEIEPRTAASTTAILDTVEQQSTGRIDFADSLDRPVARTALRETVDRLVRRARYDDLVAECAALAIERAALETGSSSDPESDIDRERAALRRQFDDVFAELDELIGTFDGDDFQAAFATCTVGDANGPHQAGNCS